MGKDQMLATFKFLIRRLKDEDCFDDVYLTLVALYSDWIRLDDMAKVASQKSVEHWSRWREVLSENTQLKEEIASLRAKIPD